MEKIPALSETVSNNPPIPASHKYKLAFVIDGVVVSTMLTDARQAAIFTSEPTIVQIDVVSPVFEGWLYDGSSFSDPTAV